VKRIKWKKLPAYFIVPVIFAVLGYGVLRVALTPVWNLAMAAASMILVEDAPNFNPELTTTYDPDAPKAEIQDDFIDAASVSQPRHGEHYGKLLCERIGLNAPVYWGDDNRILRSGAGQYEISSLPGFGEAIVICGHNTTFFKPMQKVQADDVITFDTNYDTYQYRVTEVKILQEDELATKIDSMVSEQRETLLLYTCYPFHAISGRKTKRLCVFGERIEGADVRWEA
jgi:sortase A